MSSGAERKARTRELRRLGYRGQIAFQIHEDGVDQLIALGEVSESEAEDLSHVSEVVETLINGGGLQRRITGNAQHLFADSEELPQPRRPQKVRAEIDEVLFIY